MLNSFKKAGLLLGLAFIPLCYATAQIPDTLKDDINHINGYINHNYKGMFHKSGGIFPYPFLTPGSQYSNDLWDWDSWLSNIALRQIMLNNGSANDLSEATQYEKGSILDFLAYADTDGYIPIVIWNNANPRTNKPADIYKTNMHKPVIAQHAAFITTQNGGDAEWLRDKFYLLQAFIKNYAEHHRHAATGLYYWQDDFAIGVDNDPSTFFRPPGSSGSIFLNCLMYKELKAMAYLAQSLHLEPAVAKGYTDSAQQLKDAIQANCWDERDGFYYSVDLNLLPIKTQPEMRLGLKLVLHSGHPRDYSCLIQRIGEWSGFMAMWAGIATPAQAKRMVNEHYKNKKTFNAAYGIRSLSKMEKMYSTYASSNPSNWQGPVWGISNYMVFMGLNNYGYKTEAREMAAKTITLFGNDCKVNGTFHEYYDPDSGKPIVNKGFQSWNYLVANMIAWLQNDKVIKEF